MPEITLFVQLLSTGMRSCSWEPPITTLVLLLALGVVLTPGFAVFFACSICS